MTIGEVLAEVDEINPNTIDDAVKIGWLSKLDGRIFDETILTHEHDLVDDGEGNLVTYANGMINQETLEKGIGMIKKGV